MNEEKESGDAQRKGLKLRTKERDEVAGTGRGRIGAVGRRGSDWRSSTWLKQVAMVTEFDAVS